MTAGRPAPLTDDDEDLPPEILAIIKGLAQLNARRDYSAAAGESSPRPIAEDRA